jgi:hypothetical protein
MNELIVLYVWLSGLAFVFGVVAMVGEWLHEKGVI